MSRSACSKRWALDRAETNRRALERCFLTSHGRIVAALARRFGVGALTHVENAVQEACVRALERWPGEGAPADMEAWLLRVAHNLVVDTLRRERRATELLPEHDGKVDLPTPEVDDELRLMFLCCHPVLPPAAQMALTLRVGFGLTTCQIARAFFTDERTLQQRIVRAKQRLRDAGALFELPDAADLPARLSPILDVLYLLFTEGYSPTESDSAVDAALCDETLRLVRILTSLPPTATPPAHALHALLCFQASRTEARLADDGSLLLLQEQDRARWNRLLIQEAFEAMDRAASGEQISRFHLEAGIASCHAAASTYASTDWPQIVFLYDNLRAGWPSPIVEVNRAVAVAMASGAAAGLDALDAIPERDLVARYPYALAAYAELHASLGNLPEARTFLDSAIHHQPAPAQLALLRRKRAALDP